MGDVIRIEEGILRNLFGGNQDIHVAREEVLHVSCRDEKIVSIYPRDKYAEFEESFRDPTNHGPVLRPLMTYLDREGYSTNMK